MQTVAVEPMLASGRGSLIPSAVLSHLAAGTFVTTDINRARNLYTRFFGMECVEYAHGRMLARDRRSKYLMAQDRRHFFVLDVKQTATIERPQALVNHWGFAVRDEAEVDRIRAEAVSRSDEFGLSVVHPATKMHGSYGFYMIDLDENWWEVEFRRGMTHDLLFSRGDFNTEGRESYPTINPPLDIAETSPAVVGDEAFFTHGTTAVIDCAGHREFYERVLGLRTVQHSRVSNLFAGAGDFGVVGVKAGELIQDQLPDNRFVVLIEGDESLEAAYRQVRESAERYGLKAVTDVTDGEFGGRYFLLRTRDQIWFEVSSRSPDSYTRFFRNP